MLIDTEQQPFVGGVAVSVLVEDGRSNVSRESSYGVSRNSMCTV